ncbi:hypothetical protein LINPERHAP1_LOCUS362 [Linum perenne]
MQGNRWPTWHFVFCLTSGTMIKATLSELQFRKQRWSEVAYLIFVRVAMENLIF